MNDHTPGPWLEKRIEQAPKACAWHLNMTPPQLIPLDGTTVGEALEALEDHELSHGMCPDCNVAYRAKHGLSPKAAR